MDDWALATVADLEDRTRIRGGHAPTSSVAQRRRRRRTASAQGNYSGVGTVLRETHPPGARSTGTTPVGHGRGMQFLAWGLVAAAVLVIGLGATATLVLIRSGSSDDIPTVTDIDAVVTDDIVEFTWEDPGLVTTDSYQISTSDGAPDVQQRDASFVVDAEPGDRVCITVTVNREGKTGAASGEKCAEIPS